MLEVPPHPRHWGGGRDFDFDPMDARLARMLRRTPPVVLVQNRPLTEQEKLGIGLGLGLGVPIVAVVIGLAIWASSRRQ